MPDRLEKGISIVLVAWAPPDTEVWSQVKNAINKAVRSFLSESMELHRSHPYEPFGRMAQEALGDIGDARVVYSKSQSAAIEESIEYAIAEGARQIAVVPLAFAVEIPQPPQILADDFMQHLHSIEARYPDVEILFAGPPFGGRNQMDRLVEKIREHEPEGADLLENVIHRGFRDDWSLFSRFMAKLQKTLPPETRVAMRGSTVSGYNFLTGRLFDGSGPGTSDLDVALVGDQVIARWEADGFYIPGFLSVPLDEDHPHVAPWLTPVRNELEHMVGRPVHFQAMPQWFLDLRRSLLGMPYVFLDA